MGKDRALVIGGGIGGLAAALALRRVGIETVLFEQQDDPRKIQVGGGIHMWANAMQVLRHIGVADEVGAAGAPIVRTEFRTWKGSLLATWQVGEVASVYGIQDVGIGRGELQRVLVAAQGEADLRVGMRCAGFEQDATGVTARFADGTEERGGVLIGADGIHSTIRAQLLGAEPPRYAGYAQLQALVDGAADLLPAGVERVVFGRGRRAVMHPVGGGALFWAAAIYEPEGTVAAPGTRREAMLDRFRGWEPPIEEAIGATPDEAIVGFDIYDRPPVERWSTGRVTLLGDAAHPMTTNLSQGGCQALEDAAVLASSLAGAADVPTGLRAYDERRIPRTSTLVKQSRGVARMGRIKNPVAAAVRDRVTSFVLGGPGFKDYRKLAAETMGAVDAPTAA
jgi:2-polyprenyl-6-methoxyphenol hydroxylase-like FAD-dependent oxidoreductase